jgi:hypothetical protein
VRFLASIHRAVLSDHFRDAGSPDRDLVVFAGSSVLPFTGSAACPGI